MACLGAPFDRISPSRARVPQDLSPGEDSTTSHRAMNIAPVIAGAQAKNGINPRAQRGSLRSSPPGAAELMLEVSRRLSGGSDPQGGLESRVDGGGGRQAGRQPIPTGLCPVAWNTAYFTQRAHEAHCPSPSGVARASSFHNGQPSPLMRNDRCEKRRVSGSARGFSHEPPIRRRRPDGRCDRSERHGTSAR